MKKILGCLLLAVASTQIKAQTRYVVRFKDKGTNPYSLSSPGSYLSQRSISRRVRYSINIDSTDLPVTPRYVDSVRMAGTVTVLNVSKWLNSVSIQTTDAAAITKINSLPFVQSVFPVGSRTTSVQSGKFDPEKTQLNFSAQRENDINADFFNYGSSFTQVHIHNGEFLHNIGLRGETMLIGMLDAGFNNYKTVKAFDSVRT